ncbi:hypothetical protein [Sulfolobus spindle-shaped virus]|nr:hypothetical protein [Sulfolobus spindle-shaped virus]AZG03990.1 hypothetical protein [Sulfolobus spindle-shaped virus]
MRKTLLALLTLSLALLMLTTPTGAITASQLGANQIVFTTNQFYIAGVSYSNEWFSAFFHGWNPIVYDVEGIYLRNISLGYVNNPNGNGYNEIFIGIGLSAYATGTLGGAGTPGQIINNAVLAGLYIVTTSSGSYYYYVGAETLQNGNPIIAKDSPPITGSLPISVQTYLYDDGNGTATAYITLYYSYGLLTYSFYVPYPFNPSQGYASYSALTLIGAILQLPYISGGLTSFDFTYQSNGQNYEWPNQVASGTQIMAGVYNISSSVNEFTQVSLYNGFLNNGLWSYIYSFTYPYPTTHAL